MPPDGSCFYHALYCALTHLPEAKAQKVNEMFNTYHAQLLQYVTNVDRTTTELDLPLPADINYIHTIRFIVAINVDEADFESYQMLCIAEPENHTYNTVRKWRTGMLLNLNSDYANIITINIIRRVLFQKAELDLGIYIYCVPNATNEGGLTSDCEWHDKPYNIFLELVNNVHYNLICFNALADAPGAGLVLTPEQLLGEYNRKFKKRPLTNKRQRTTKQP
jgi:hypothetical protein